jgi:UDP-N-acetylmuramate dehydrogenase
MRAVKDLRDREDGPRGQTAALLAREVPGLRLDVPLAPFTAYRVGGPAEFLAEATSSGAIVQAVAAGRAAGVPVTVLGQATNVLVCDGGIPGLVVLARSSAWTITDDVMECDAGAVLSEVVLDLAERGHAGLEFAGNIPGSVGGAVVGNAGAYGRSVADVLLDVSLLHADGRVGTVEPTALELGYRTSVLKTRRPSPLTGAVVLGARFRLQRGVRTALLDEIARDAALRRSKHPLEYASCGSYFKNPSSDMPAARYIEQAGLKGLTVGRAQVSERHANFLVALDGARAADILALADEVKRRVLEHAGVALEEEVVRLGLQ